MRRHHSSPGTCINHGLRALGRCSRGYGTLTEAPPASCSSAAPGSDISTAIRPCWLTFRTCARMSDEEEPVPAFDANHYPDGVNANFKTDDAEGLRTKYAGPKGMFEDAATRDIAGNIGNILGILPDLEGLTVADVGAGTGLFMVELDRMVGATGKLYAIEISTGFLKLLREHVETKGLSRTTVLEGSDLSPNLPAQSIDLAFIADVYHHFEKPVTYMKALLEAMKPGGVLVLIDFHRDPARIWSRPPNWVMEHVRAGQDVFQSEIEQAGFIFEKEVVIETLRENYILLFRKAK